MLFVGFCSFKPFLNFFYTKFCQYAFPVFLCLLAKFLAASTEPKPHALSAKAFLVGVPSLFFIGPFIPANRAAKLIRRGLVPSFTGALRLDPSVLFRCFLPASLKPPGF